LSKIREISKVIATAVCKQCEKEGLNLVKSDDWSRVVADYIFDPKY
jgi:hypothetical protein